MNMRRDLSRASAAARNILIEAASRYRPTLPYHRWLLELVRASASIEQAIRITHLLRNQKFPDQIRIKREPSCRKYALKGDVGALCHFEQTVLAVGQVEQPQEIHLAGSTGLLLSGDRPVEPASSELGFASAVGSYIRPVSVEQVEQVALSARRIDRVPRVSQNRDCRPTCGIPENVP